MRSAIVALLCIMLAFSLYTFPPAFAQTEGSVIREVSNKCPEPGETLTVTVLPIGIGTFYAVEEHLGFLEYTGEHTADSNPEGTIFTNLTPRSFTYRARVPSDPDTGKLPSGVDRLAITGEFWTDPGAKEAVGQTILCVPTVSISPSLQEMSPGESFSAAIDVDPGGLGVSAASVILSFDPVIMRVESVEMGDFLGGNAILAPGFPHVDNIAGTVKIDAARMGATSAPSTRGTLATIRLAVNDEAQILKRIGAATGGKIDTGKPTASWYPSTKYTAVTYPGLSGTLQGDYGTSKLVLTKTQLADENARDIAEVSSVDAAVSVMRAQEILPQEPDPEESEEIEAENEGNEYARWDLNEDCTVDEEDLAIMGVHYGDTTQEPYPRADINEDGFVDIKDLSLLAAHWGETTGPCPEDVQQKLEEPWSKWLDQYGKGTK